MPIGVVAEDDAWLSSLGVEPQTEGSPAGELIREVVVPIAEDEEVRITWSVVDGSVRVRHIRSHDCICDLFRDWVTLLTVAGGGSAVEVIVEYGSDGWNGRARVQVLPSVRIEDVVLRT